jgi:arylsulfatase A-like enzyme
VAKDIRPGMPNQTPAGYNRPTAPGVDTWSPSDPKFDGFWKGGTHWSEVVANHSAEFLSEAKDRDDPFFMYLAFNAPHDPRQSPAEYVAKYPLENVLLPENFQSMYPYAEEMGAGKKLRDEKLAPFPRTPHAVKVHRQEYYAIITHMDEMIGRISEPIYLQDVMPTSLELAGMKKPEHVEFNSLLPLLAGGESPYKNIYGAYLGKQRSIRTDEYKLIAYPNANKLRLYDVRNDPLEIKDLANDPASEAIKGELFAQLQSLQAAMNDDLDLSALAPDSALIPAIAE